MSPKPDLTLPEQRLALQQRLRAQRQMIAQQLGPAPRMDTGYPRSMTMRFLTRQPALVTGLLAQAAAVLFGARYFKSLSASLALAKLVRAARSR